ncbi:type II secretion system minor pseudopilin GspK [Wenzhouxiangella limi]|uniref:Type II secretion system protein K n=1 Tax=Wenzhouxiangella limi TaxID=2707351 RepID=A0A845V955_9GAMM|nr:type II secretion system minor pseudopilin GspK [Wenzhouxiangella limi]NDY96455.1 type II secretion system minor pseudopilin GspK [Wenzhouxiangella limi]
MVQRFRQRGSALLIALVAVALATVLAVGLLERAQRAMARTEALISGERSYQYALAMEALVARMMTRARAEGLDAALADGAWTPPYDVPGGQVRGRLLDQQGRFNLNALASPDGALARRAERRLERLLEVLGQPPAVAAELADWIEGDAAIRSGSVGDFWYAAQQPAYRMSGLPLAHVSELRWLRSVDSGVYEVLLPHVTALPDPRLRVNVNSTSAEVLSVLVEGLDVESARRVLADGPFTDPAQLSAHPLLAGLLTPDVERELLVSSEWYLAQARVVLEEIERDFFRLMTLDGAGYDFRYASQGLL